MCSSYIFFMLFFRLPEKNMNENKSLFKIFSSLAARCCGRWRFFRALFMLLLKLVLGPLLVVLLLPLTTTTTSTVMLSTMLFFCCRWSDDDDGDHDDDDQQEDDRDVVRRTSAVVALCLWCLGATPVCVPRRVLFCMKVLPRRSPRNEISSICVSFSTAYCTLHGQLCEFFFASIVATTSYSHITHRYCSNIAQTL